MSRPTYAVLGYSLQFAAGILLIWLGVYLSSEVSAQSPRSGGGFIVIFWGLPVAGMILAAQGFVHLSIILGRACFFFLQRVFVGEQKLHARQQAVHNYNLLIYAMAAGVAATHTPNKAQYQALSTYYSEVTNRRITWRRLRKLLSGHTNDQGAFRRAILSSTAYASPDAKRIAYAAAVLAILSGSGDQRKLDEIAYLTGIRNAERGELELWVRQRIQ